MTLAMTLSGGGGSLAALQPPPGYQSAGGLWIRADKGVAFGSVASWPDLSGNGNNFTQGTGSAQPVCTAGAGPKASQPAVVFTAANSQSLTRALALLPTKNFTLAIVGKSLSTASAMTWINVGSGAGSDGWLIGTDGNSDGARNFNANGVSAVDGGAATTSWEAWIFSSDASGNLTLFVNGTSVSPSASPVTAAAPTARTDLGTFGSSSSRFLNGSLFEVVIYPAALASVTALKSYQSAVTGLF